MVIPVRNIIQTIDEMDAKISKKHMRKCFQEVPPILASLIIEILTLCCTKIRIGILLWLGRMNNTEGCISYATSLQVGILK